MEIERKIYNKMLTWKNECNGSKALFLEGARRIGKSTIAQKFAQNEYASFILLDFNNVSKKIKDNFNNLNDLNLFYQTLSLEYNVKLYQRNSLIIFDEIQKFPRGRDYFSTTSGGRYGTFQGVSDWGTFWRR